MPQIVRSISMKNLGFTNATRKNCLCIALYYFIVTVMDWSGLSKLIAVHLVCIRCFTSWLIIQSPTHPRYSTDFKQMNSKLIALKESILFFILPAVLLLRNARLLVNIQPLDWGFMDFFLAFLGAVFYLGWETLEIAPVVTPMDTFKWDAGKFCFSFGALYLGSLMSCIINTLLISPISQE